MKANNVILCPVETPYVVAGSTNCQQCPPSVPVFNLQTNSCTNQSSFFVSPSGSGVLGQISNNVNVTNLNGNNWILGNVSLSDYY